MPKEIRALADRAPGGPADKGPGPGPGEWVLPHQIAVDALKPGVGLTKNSPPYAACYCSAMGPVDALYENGLLRPVSPLPLRPGERVALIVVRKADPARWDLARLAAHGGDDLALAEAGLDDWAAALDREDRG